MLVSFIVRSFVLFWQCLRVVVVETRVRARVFLCANSLRINAKGSMKKIIFVFSCLFKKMSIFVETNNKTHAMNTQPSFYVFATYENLGAIYEPITEIMYRSLEQIMVMQNALGNRERLFIYNYHTEAEAARNEMMKPVEWDYTNID